MSFCPPKGKGTASDPVSEELHPEAQYYYMKANTAYRKDENRVFEKICIHSGKRPVIKQALLYRNYIHHKEYGGEYTPKANNPGYSIHEYGCAIDIIRGQDEARLKLALESNGWKQHSDTQERHHFEARSAPSWNKIKSKRNKILQKHISIKNDIIKHIEHSIAHEDIEENYEICRDDLRHLNAELRNIRRRLTRYKARAAELNDDLDDLQLATDVAELEVTRLRRKINSFKYTYCPNQRTYRKCDHKEQKARYRKEKQLMKDDLGRAKREVYDLEKESLQMEHRIDLANEQIIETEKRTKKTKIKNDLAAKRERILRKNYRKSVLKLKTIWSKVSSRAVIIQKEIDGFLYKSRRQPSN